tara:strand:- start:109 stop:480 length:372 start_codon:yes stop_codon:yes gene_type:complete
MGTFIHNGNKIIINGESFIYEIFSLLEPEYTLSDGEIGRVYEQGEKHYTTTGKRQIPQPLKWLDGDRYIARINDLRMLVIEKKTTEQDRKDRIIEIKNRKYIEEDRIQREQSKKEKLEKENPS